MCNGDHWHLSVGLKTCGLERLRGMRQVELLAEYTYTKALRVYDSKQDTFMPRRLSYVLSDKSSLH